MVVEVLTDKVTRSVQFIRNTLKDCGAKLADPGSVTFRFRQARVVNVKVTDAEKDQLLSVALDVGADDVIEPNFDDIDDELDDGVQERYQLIFTCIRFLFAAIISFTNEISSPSALGLISTYPIAEVITSWCCDIERHRLMNLVCRNF
jgi:hypothetical protein